MRKIDADRLKRKAQKVATEAWLMKTKANVETTLNQFIDWIDAEPTVDDWIPVTEKLPPKGVDVIVTDIETVETYVGYYMGEGYWDTDNGPYRDRIIAWKPKPEPYKGE